MKNILLVGNANTGKTTLLNTLTKSEEHTGNWHGVTVEEKQKFYKYENEIFGVVDLPGIYSLNSLSLEEQVSIDYIFSHPNDLIINTADINTLEKNLFLTLDLLSAQKNLVLVVNNMGKKNNNIDIQKIKKVLNIDVLIINFDNKNDVNKLKKYIKNYYDNKKIINNENNIVKNIFLPKTYETISNLASYFDLNNYEIIKLIEKNNYYSNKNKEIINNFNKINNINYFNLAKEKYLYINKILNNKNNSLNNKKNKNYGNNFLDKILLNKFLSIPIFFVIMLGIFYLTFFSIGAFFSDFLSDLIQVKLGGIFISWLESFCEISWVIGLLENGLFAGVGSLVSFLPQVVLLFLFLAILEDTGYFSRIAFMFEDFFSSIGLSGKSVYTLLMGFGCSASAVLTARAMDSRTAKIKTAILTPYMSCSAKLPIYAILGGAFFGAGNIFIIFLLYLLGVFTALFVSVLLDNVGLKNKENAFLIEFPPYRFPKIKKICKIAWLNFKLFLIKITTIFISMSIIIWCLDSFSFAFEYVVETGGKSILQVLGEFFAPLFAPLGFNNWGAVGALIAGIVAKEIIVSSIAIFNGVSVFGDGANVNFSRSLMDNSSAVSFTASSAISFLSFCLLYCPCLATMAIMRKEIGLKWTLFAIALQLIIAYIVAFMVFNLYNLTEILGLFSTICLGCGILIILIAVFRFISLLKQKNKCKLCGLCKR